MNLKTFSKGTPLLTRRELLSKLIHYDERTRKKPPNYFTESHWNDCENSMVHLKSLHGSFCLFLDTTLNH